MYLSHDVEEGGWVGETVPLKAGPQNLSRAGVILDEAPGVGDAR